MALSLKIFIPEKIAAAAKRILQDLTPQGVIEVKPTFGFPNGKVPARWYMLISGKISNSKKFKPVPETIDGFPIVHSTKPVEIAKE